MQNRQANHPQTLDDFDFTVLAATSVLGDLMEKCPPAEACRDAFERMSKATVQMCMSTPGFGFSLEREEPRQPLSRQTSKQNMSTMPMQIDSYPSARVAHKHSQKRPPPKFDMDLRELFPEDLEPSVRPSHSTPMPLPGLQRPGQGQPGAAMGMPQQDQHSPRQQQLSPTSSINSQVNPGMANNTPLLYAQRQSQQPFYMQNTYNPDFMSGLPGMDFLNNTGGNGDGDFNFDAGGLDLGFGMGLDYQHDWSDGQQFDLFDGFFFGNGGGGGGVNGAGGGNSSGS